MLTHISTRYRGTFSRRWFLRFSLRTLMLLALLIGSAGGLYHRWQPWAEVWRSPQHAKLPLAARFIHSGDLLLTDDVNVRVFETVFWSEAPALEGSLASFEMSRDGQLFLLRSAEATAVYRTPDLSLKTKVVPAGLALSAHFSPNSRRFVTTTTAPTNPQLRTAQVWDAATGNLICALPEGSEFEGDVAFADDESLVVQAAPTLEEALFGGCHRRVYRSATTGQEIQPEQDAQLNGAAGPSRLVAAAWRKSILIKDESGVTVSTIGAKDEMVLACLAPDSARIAAVSDSGRIHIFDASGAELAKLPACAKGVLFVCFSEDAQRLAATDQEGRVRVWVRRRPEQWWGLAWLAEFWLTLICALAFGWSVQREHRLRALRNHSAVR